jgi:putative flippase GtrA
MFLRFLLVGGSGFLIDAGITSLLIALDLPSWLARIPAICLALAYTWLANRYFTYAVKTARSSSEAMRYAAVAAVMALINYSVYFVLVQYGVLPVIAVTIATTCQTTLSFHCYRHFVFRTTR